MYSMDVTLDVSRLSGWLNAEACCRVKGGHTTRGEVGAGRRQGDAEAAAAQPACKGEGPTGGVGAQEIGGAHVEHVLHGCDARSIEAQWLVERRRVLPTRKEGI